jgi:hypothetical protein
MDAKVRRKSVDFQKKIILFFNRAATKNRAPNDFISQIRNIPSYRFQKAPQAKRLC